MATSFFKGRETLGPTAGMKAIAAAVLRKPKSDGLGSYGFAVHGKEELAIAPAVALFICVVVQPPVTSRSSCGANRLEIRNGLLSECAMKQPGPPSILLLISLLAVTPASGQVSSRTGLPAVGGGHAAFRQYGADHDFAMAAAVFSKFSVIAGQLAMIETRNRELREFAELMVDDHTAALARLRTIAGHASISLPAVIGPDDAYRARIAAVQDRTGSAFDRAYCAQQMDALRDAEVLLQSYVNAGRNAQFRKWGVKMIGLVQQHQRLLNEIMSDGSRP